MIDFMREKLIEFKKIGIESTFLRILSCPHEQYNAKGQFVTIHVWQDRYLLSVLINMSSVLEYQIGGYKKLCRFLTKSDQV